MVKQGSRTSLALTGTVLVFAVATTACGGRRVIGTDADAASGTFGTSSAAPSAVAIEPAGSGMTPAADLVASPETRSPGTTDKPGASPPPVGPSASVGSSSPTPLATPDLSAIQQWLDAIDAALGVDATAETDEGSAN